MKNFESTYALLVRSEEKSRSLMETLAYALFVLSAVFTIWQFAHQSVSFPLDKVTGASTAVIATQGS